MGISWGYDGYRRYRYITYLRIFKRDNMGISWGYDGYSHITYLRIFKRDNMGISWEYDGYSHITYLRIFKRDNMGISRGYDGYSHITYLRIFKGDTMGISRGYDGHSVGEWGPLNVFRTDTTDTPIGNSQATPAERMASTAKLSALNCYWLILSMVPFDRMPAASTSNTCCQSLRVNRRGFWVDPILNWWVERVVTTWYGIGINILWRHSGNI